MALYGAALNLDSVKFSPSYLLAIEDQLLAYSFLRHCVAAYIPEGADPKKRSAPKSYKSFR